MANFVLIANNIYIGAAADTKPTTNVPNGSKAIETDTGREYKYVNSEWIERDVIEFFESTKKMGGIMGGSGSSTGGAVGFWSAGLVAHTLGSGTYGNPSPDSNGLYAAHATGTTINSICGTRTSGTQTERDLNPWTIWKIRLRTAITNCRMFIGLRSSTSAAASSADPLANISGVGFWFDTGVHATNIAIMQNSGAASSDFTTIPNVGTMTISAINTYEIRADNANTRWQYRFNGFPNGSWNTINTAIPAATTDLQWVFFEENLDTVSHNLDMYYVKCKQDG